MHIDCECHTLGLFWLIMKEMRTLSEMASFQETIDADQYLRLPLHRSCASQVSYGAPGIGEQTNCRLPVIKHERKNCTILNILANWHPCLKYHTSPVLILQQGNPVFQV